MLIIVKLMCRTLPGLYKLLYLAQMAHTECSGRVINAHIVVANRKLSAKTRCPY
jgi:hypothetical protein